MSVNSTIEPHPTKAKHDARQKYAAEHVIRIGKLLGLLMPNNVKLRGWRSQPHSNVRLERE